MSRTIAIYFGSDMTGLDFETGLSGRVYGDLGAGAVRLDGSTVGVSIPNLSTPEHGLVTGLPDSSGIPYAVTVVRSGGFGTVTHYADDAYYPFRIVPERTTGQTLITLDLELTQGVTVSAESLSLAEGVAGLGDWIVTGWTRQQDDFSLTFIGGASASEFSWRGSASATILIIQTFPAPTLGANSYLSVPDALFRMPQISPLLVSFAQLDPSRQVELLVQGTKRIELETRCYLKGSSKVEPETQVLAFGRDNAWSAAGPLIDTVLQSWIDGILLYVDELAEAELLGEEVSEPAEDAGLTQVEISSEGVRYREEWAKEGFSADFFRPRQKMFSLLAESFPHGVPS